MSKEKTGIVAAAAGLGAAYGADAGRKLIKPELLQVVDPNNRINNFDGTVSHHVLSTVVQNQDAINTASGALALVGAIGLGYAAHKVLAKGQFGK